MTVTAARSVRITARVWEDRGRLCVRFVFATTKYVPWRDFLADWRHTFVRPRYACWRPAAECWSVRASERTRLMEWLESWGLDIQEGQG